MKSWLTAFAMCQSMFCAIPSPWHSWDEKVRDQMLLCLPIVGLEIGALWWAVGMLCRMLALPAPVIGLALCAWPYLATGYMHLDGFMDVTDAVRSYRSLERRREILKDSHVGSFAVINVALLLLAQFVFAYTGAETMDLRILILIPVVSRCGSVLAVMLLPPMTTSQYAGRQKTASSVVLPLFLLAAAVAAGFLICGKSGFGLIACAAGFLLALRRAYKSLEGMNGDISGYALTLAELTALAACALL